MMTTRAAMAVTATTTSNPQSLSQSESGENVTGTNVELLVQEGESLTVEGKAGENLVFDTEALKNIASQTQERLVLSGCSTDHGDAIPAGSGIHDDHSGDKRITNFGNGSVTVSLPYELKREKNRRCYRMVSGGRTEQ